MKGRALTILLAILLLTGCAWWPVSFTLDESGNYTGFDRVEEGYTRQAAKLYGWVVLEDLTIREICANAGITTGMFYRHFVSKDDEYLSDALLEHIREMIQLEHGVKIDGSQYLMVMSDDEADELQAHWDEYEGVKAIYASKEVLFTTEQNALFAGVEIHTIPDYYFNFELKEVGETW